MIHNFILWYMELQIAKEVVAYLEESFDSKYRYLVDFNEKEAIKELANEMYIRGYYISSKHWERVDEYIFRLKDAPKGSWMIRRLRKNPKIWHEVISSYKVKI
ncbi:hypothetical protein [Bacillus cereus]|uniref:Uncharacterized protein n=1 Tax=Bacillus cereus TaxID=1396 RepID=A0A164P651_BACCE|nr:hypothetical protein [Bacillus cereus]KZD66314.1 hypothetical protein B4088_2430 [Bacillus cereus]